MSGYRVLSLLQSSGELELDYLELIELHRIPDISVIRYARKNTKLHSDLAERGFLKAEDYGYRSKSQHDYVEVKDVKEGFLSGYVTSSTDYLGWNALDTTNFVFVASDGSTYRDPQKMSNNVFASEVGSQMNAISIPPALELNTLKTLILEIKLNCDATSEDFWSNSAVLRLEVEFS
jgi:hypothetical protein